MKLDRNTRRLLTHLQKVGVPQVTDITESLHILAQAGLIEYEAYKCFPDMVRAWAVLHTGEVDTDEQKDQEILTLRAEINRVHDEYTWLASRKQKPTKEQTMAKVSIDVQDAILGGGVVVGSAIISVEVPDDAVATIATMYERCLPLIFRRTTHEHVCKCEASNDDKRPGTAATYRDRSNVN